MKTIMYKKLIFTAITVYLAILLFNFTYSAKINKIYINMLVEQAEKGNPDFYLNWFDYYENTPIYEITDSNNLSLSIYNVVAKESTDGQYQKIVQGVIYDVSLTILEKSKQISDEYGYDNKLLFEFNCGNEINSIDLSLEYYSTLPIIAFNFDNDVLNECGNLITDMKIFYSNVSLIESLDGELDTSKSTESVINDSIVGFTADEKHHAIKTSAGYNPMNRVLLTIILPYSLIFIVGGYYFFFIRTKK